MLYQWKEECASNIIKKSLYKLKVKIEQKVLLLLLSLL
jgi:hypothetical protein